MQVIKRDGQVAPFSINKISVAVSKAFDACHKPYDSEIIDLICLRVTSDFTKKVVNGQIGVEDIQDSVESVLSSAGYGDVAKAYILYRKQRENVRNITSTTLDYKNIVDAYLEQLDHGNQSHSPVGGLILSNSGAITANYWLYEVYEEEIAKAHRENDLHIHDLHMLTGYGTGWSLLKLICLGVMDGKGQMISAPAKHLKVLCNQMVDFLGMMQNEWAGAQTFASFDTYLAPYVKADQLDYQDVKQALQSFVYGLNMTSRFGIQAPNTSVLLDVIVPKDLKELPCVVGNTCMSFTYQDVQSEMDMINRALLEVLQEKDASGNRFAFPIPVYMISQQFPWNSDFSKQLFEVSLTNPTIQFMNVTSSDLKQNDVRSVASCKHDYSVLHHKCGGYIGSGEGTGSIGEVSINLARIGYVAEDAASFYVQLDRVLELAIRSLTTKRTVLTKLLEAGMYPYSKAYGVTFRNHFSTIGIVGMNEAVLNAKWLKHDLNSEDSITFAKEVLAHIRTCLLDAQQKYQVYFELEAPQAEKARYLFAQADTEKYPDCVTQKDGDVYYSRSTQCTSTTDLFSYLDHQEVLQQAYNGGTILDIPVEDTHITSETLENLLQVILQNYHFPYMRFCIPKKNDAVDVQETHILYGNLDCAETLITYAKLHEAGIPCCIVQNEVYDTLTLHDVIQDKKYVGQEILEYIKGVVC